MFPPCPLLPHKLRSKKHMDVPMAPTQQSHTPFKCARLGPISLNATFPCCQMDS